METAREKIYCAGPLFTAQERQEMKAIASALERAGYATFLPQRDGLELTKCVECLVADGSEPDQARRLMSRAIFALDIYQVLHGCDALVANLNGRVPDEGTVSEAAMAWSRGKPVVGYKADTRTVFGGQDNPLVAGLFSFELCQTIEEAVRLVQRGLRNRNAVEDHHAAREKEIGLYAELGGAISSALDRNSSLQEIVDLIVRFASTLVNA